MSTVVSDEIKRSWTRSQSFGLDPTESVRVVIEGFNPESRLLRAARPVLDALRDDIEGFCLGALLANHRAVIVRQEFGVPSLALQTHSIGAEPGAVFDEEHSGTNAIATPFECRMAHFVERDEHYLESLRQFVCFGAPIINPVTRRLHGVLDLMAPAETQPQLMRTVTAKAVRDIQNSLAGDYDDSTRFLVATFESMNRTARSALILFKGDLILQNTQAIDLLSRDDVMRLRSQATGPNSPPHSMFDLHKGGRALVEIRLAGDSGAILHVERAEGHRKRPPLPRGRTAEPDAYARGAQAAMALSAGHVLISGEPGTGRTTVARFLAEDSVPMVDLHRGGDPIGQITKHIQNRTNSVIVEGLEFVKDDEALLLRLASALKDASHTRVILTGGPAESMSPAVRSVAAMTVSDVELAPLRLRLDEIPSIAQSMLRRRGVDSVRLTFEAIEALQAHSWPGNLTELSIVLGHAISHDPVRDIAAADLPERYQVKPFRRNLTVLERAEREAVRSVLAMCSGNKVQAARHLGVSRSTLYKRIRYFELD